MSADRVEQALARIEAAAARIEVGTARAGKLGARHAELRQAVSQSLREIDSLIAGQGA